MLRITNDRYAPLAKNVFDIRSKEEKERYSLGYKIISNVVFQNQKESMDNIKIICKRDRVIYTHQVMLDNVEPITVSWLLNFGCKTMLQSKEIVVEQVPYVQFLFNFGISDKSLSLYDSYPPFPNLASACSLFEQIRPVVMFISKLNNRLFIKMDDHSLPKQEADVLFKEYAEHTQYLIQTARIFAFYKLNQNRNQHEKFLPT